MNGIGKNFSRKRTHRTQKERRPVILLSLPLRSSPRSQTHLGTHLSAQLHCRFPPKKFRPSVIPSLPSALPQSSHSYKSLSKFPSASPSSALRSSSAVLCAKLSPLCSLCPFVAKKDFFRGERKILSNASHLRPLAIPPFPRIR